MSRKTEEVIITEDVKSALKEKAKNLEKTKHAQSQKYDELCLEYLVTVKKDLVNARRWMDIYPNVHDEMLEDLMKYVIDRYWDGVDNDLGNEIIDSLHFVKLFLDYHFNPYIHSEEKPSILITAIKDRRQELAELLVDAKVVPRADEIGFALVEAIKQNDVIIAKRLLDVAKHAEHLEQVLNSIEYTHDGTLLHLAASLPGSEKMVLLLIEYGANPRIRNSQGQTPDEVVCAQGNASVAVKIFYYLQMNSRFGKRHKQSLPIQRHTELPSADTVLDTLKRVFDPKSHGFLRRLTVNEPLTIYTPIHEIASCPSHRLKLNLLVEKLLFDYYCLKKIYLLENSTGNYLNQPSSSKAKAIKPKLDVLRDSIVHLMKHSIARGLINENELDHFIAIMKKNCLLEVTETGMGWEIYKNENNYIFKDFKQKLQEFNLINEEQSAGLYENTWQVGFDPISKLDRKKEDKLAEQSITSLVPTVLRSIPEEEQNKNLVTDIRLVKVYRRLSANEGCVSAADYFDYYDIKRLVQNGSLEAALVLANIHASGFAPETCIETDDNIMSLYQQVKENCQNQLQDLHTSESHQKKLQQILHYIDIRIAMFSGKDIDNDVLFSIFHVILSSGLYTLEAKLFLDEIITNSTLDVSVIKKAKLIKVIYNDQVSLDIRTLVGINVAFYQELLVIMQTYGQVVPPEWQLDDVFVPSAPLSEESPEFSEEESSTAAYTESVMDYHRQVDGEEQQEVKECGHVETYSPDFFGAIMHYYERIHGVEQTDEVTQPMAEEMIPASSSEQISEEDQEKIEMLDELVSLETLLEQEIIIDKLEEAGTSEASSKQGTIDTPKEIKVPETPLVSQSPCTTFSKQGKVSTVKSKDKEPTKRKEQKQQVPQLA